MMHGGNIYRAAEELGLHEKGITDFSASINPLGVPRSVSSEIRRNIRYLVNYPDPDSRQLTSLLGERLNIDPETLVCGNGSTELIYLIARALRPGSVLVPAPTFVEYERAVRLNTDPGGGSIVSYFRLCAENNFDIDPDEFIQAMSGKLSFPRVGNLSENQEGFRTSRNDRKAAEGGFTNDCTNNPSRLAHHASRPFDMAFLCNPNNPTGRLLRKHDVMTIAAAAERLGCYLVVDEAFIDFLPGESVITEVEKNPRLIVLRSMTKFYALSGLRLGYGIFPPHLIGAMKRHKEPWTVNTLSQKAGVTALKDAAYEEETFRVVAREKEFMEEGLKRLGISFFPSSVNYYLLRLDGAQEIVASLRSEGILVRDCSSFVGLDGSYVRVAVKSRRDNALLLRELSKMRTEKWLKA